MHAPHWPPSRALRATTDLDTCNRFKPTVHSVVCKSQTAEIATCGLLTGVHGALVALLPRSQGACASQTGSINHARPTLTYSIRLAGSESVGYQCCTQQNFAKMTKAEVENDVVEVGPSFEHAVYATRLMQPPSLSLSAEHKLAFSAL